MSSTWSLSLRFYHQNPVCTFRLHAFHLHLCLPRGLFPSGFTTKTLCAPLASMRSIYTCVFYVVSFPQVLPPKPCVHLSPPCVPSTPVSSTWSLSLRFYHQNHVCISRLHAFHVSCLSFFLIRSRKWYLMRSTDGGVYQYAVSFSPLLPPSRLALETFKCRWSW